MEFGFVIAAVGSIAVQALFNWEDETLVALNEVLSSRLCLGYQALQEYGLTLFGQQVTWIGQGRQMADPTSTYNYVDNAYLQIGITFGVLFLILLAIGFYLTGRYLIAHKEYKLSWAMVMAIAYGVLNAHLCMPAFNVFILVLGCCFKKVGEKDSLPFVLRIKALKGKGYKGENNEIT